jgi:hypothetical protein
LAEKKRRTDSASGSGTQPIDEESRSELELTDEGRAFLLQLGTDLELLWSLVSEKSHENSSDYFKERIR